MVRVVGVLLCVYLGGISVDGFTLLGQLQNSSMELSQRYRRQLQVNTSLASSWLQKIGWYDGQMTALGRAVEARDLPLLEFLIGQSSESFFDNGDGRFIHLYQRQVKHPDRTVTTETVSFESGQASWVNVVDDHGRSPLAIAAGIEEHRDSTEIISLLLEHGAKINVLAKDSRLVYASPLAHAVATLNVESVKVLLDNGADVNLFDSSRIGSVPLFSALTQIESREGREILELLLEHGADLNLATSTTGRSILDKMIVSASTEAVRFMVQHGVDVNHTDRERETVIHKIVRFSSKSDNFLDSLLQAPAIDLDIQNGNKGETALMVAARWGNLEAVKKLVSNGANTQLLNNDGHSARDLAYQRMIAGYHYRDRYQKIINILTKSSPQKSKIEHAVHLSKIRKRNNILRFKAKLKKLQNLKNRK